jgi:stromal membrane-associated protein
MYFSTHSGASLNFGVFLCSNCSGAHRALGPTITRVKSTKLDQWQKEWMECMHVGNKEVNEYWESDLGMAK